MEAPIYIIGNPRSGTTLLRLMLTCHRNIVIPPECGFAVWFYDKYRDWVPSRDSFRLREFMNDLFQSRKFEHWRVNEEELVEFVSERKPDSYPRLVSHIYEFYGLSRGRSFKRCGDKNNFHLRHVLTIKTMFPSAHFVHLVRDGRDVACSFKRLGERKLESAYAPHLPDEVGSIAEQWKTNIQVATESFAAIQWENVHEIRFENLVTNSEQSLRDLCGKIGEEYDPFMLEYHIRNREQELEPREMLPWKQKNLKPPIQEEVGRYKTELSTAEIAEFNRIAGTELARYGYLDLRTAPGA